MTPTPFTVEVTDTLQEAARVMRSRDVGDVLVTEGTRLHGSLTNRDIVVRAVATGRQPDRILVGDCCSQQLYTVGTSDTTDRAAEQMRRHALRRLPVLEDGQLVGVVTLGDLAMAEDPR